ncbi:uncharacterized protein Bfra_000565 [Botrytis fragariae]|uniref:Uncharacterized protein n=1 Tax=Botrytis fragariae TaxID=1964551 RepID=A0A8H6ENI3_9HELO|nr:uncharacterized protein Bfra_000565 [Botrytis fragariae]KAF5878400.1 hypothetical protein Bfra_000565 [Botrytis fragariae]
MPILNLTSLTGLLPALLSTNHRSARGSVGEYSKVGEFLKIEPTEHEPEIRNRGIPFLNLIVRRWKCGIVLSSLDSPRLCTINYCRLFKKERGSKDHLRYY